ncbi:protein THYLAKOID ASSEMBLY 8, chloroplastic-like [Andrographis paniculata]|uniref:protein THYLAKOID ASSEMBLY 8, chloroplastic-like n=1 Tax=Andrographis paniculata TaxID=175694 RepID=UPI0021E99754|nr:protein THYLAKOID ASSEMBLY 8, chloroplastic-like [Andrographis paniculata]
MAASLHCNLALLPSTVRRIAAVRCGPRDNRPPIMKGRILSTEAIQAIQSLKRAHRIDPANLPTHILTRLIKADLTSAMHELLRQDHWDIAAGVFSTLRSEHGADLSAYAEFAAALARNGLAEQIDSLVDELEQDGGIRRGNGKAVLRLVKAVVGAGRRESTVRIYAMVKSSGCEMDEYLGRVFSRGLRRLGEVSLAKEVESIYKGNFVN